MQQANLSPLLDQYFALKKEASESILLFRVGDFYEAYGEDAKLLSKVLEIVLTGRDVRGDRIPMAGVPHHTLDNHLKTLISRGYNVAVSEQMEEAGEAKGLIHRDIVRFLTPGTVIEPDLLSEKEPNYLLALIPGEITCGFSWCDVSTGTWFASVVKNERELLYYEINKIAPKEIVLLENQLHKLPLELPSEAKISYLTDGKASALDKNVATFPEEAKQACGVLSRYLQQVYRNNPPRLFSPIFHETENYLILNPVTRRNLELFLNLSSGKVEGSLIHLLDQTKTPMGARLIRDWLLHPLLNITEIQKRLQAVNELFNNDAILRRIQKSLSSIGDLERLAGRVSYQSANARDLLAIKEILQQLPSLKTLVSPLLSDLFKEFIALMPDFSLLSDELENAIHPEPPLGLKEGGLIKEGFDSNLDELKRELKEATTWIAELEEREKKTTGIKSLRVGFNQIFGYYLEVTKTHLASVPKHYIRKQTLANAERYVIEELKNQEAKILSGQEKIKKYEYQLFCTLREKVKEYDLQLKWCSTLLSTLDTISSLAFVAEIHNFRMPGIDHENEILIKAGRHPVVEAAGLEPFVPNDCVLDSKENRLLIITGPNMAGKSTYLRQVALMVILAQMGSFVPAEAAQIGIVDAIFTRIGASDDLHRGESTFYVEMKEASEILKRATPKSLVLLDEIGRGTSTFDGLSLAWAIAENLLQARAKVLFATHYHEMTTLAEHFKGAKNFAVAVKEYGNNVIFLRQIFPGCADKSYGIHVAKLAGIPEEVVERANQLLKALESRDLGRKISKRYQTQLSFFQAEQEENKTEETDQLLESLKTLDLNRLTGLEALTLLSQWQQHYL